MAGVPSDDPLSATITEGWPGSAASRARVEASCSRRFLVITTTVTRCSDAGRDGRPGVAQCFLEGWDTGGALPSGPGGKPGPPASVNYSL
jgi:hypothetical protein